MTHELPNLERVTADLYVVRTQAGFAKALKEFNEDRGYEAHGYPRSYPALAHFTTDYAGYHYIQVHCWPISKIAEVCARHTPVAPKYEEDDGPLTDVQIDAIRKASPATGTPEEHFTQSLFGKGSAYSD